MEVFDEPESFLASALTVAQLEVQVSKQDEQEVEVRLLADLSVMWK